MNNLPVSSIDKDSSNKAIVAHYHLFKNAGTSVDAILSQNFGSAWQKIEFAKIPQQSNSFLVDRWLREHPKISAFSSHTALFPLPKIDRICIPIVFLRHPIVRLHSVYKFERKHRKILNDSISLAKECDFADYLNHRLDRVGDRACRNFQTYRFSWLNSQSDLSELERALEGLNILPIVGIVEEFDLSMKYYSEAIAQYYPAFTVKSIHKNITSQRSLSQAEKLELVRSNLDRATYQRLLDCNRDDLQLYEAAKRKLSQLSKETVHIK